MGSLPTKITMHLSTLAFGKIHWPKVPSSPENFVDSRQLPNLKKRKKKKKNYNGLQYEKTIMDWAQFIDSM